MDVVRVLDTLEALARSMENVDRFERLYVYSAFTSIVNEFTNYVCCHPDYMNDDNIKGQLREHTARMRDHLNRLAGLEEPGDDNQEVRWIVERINVLRGFHAFNVLGQ